MSQLIVYTTFRTSRLEYISHFLFKELLGLKVELTVKEDYFQRANAAKINYSSKKIDIPCIQIIPHNLLKESGLGEQKIILRYENSIPYFFPTSESADFHCDVLASSFYLLTRYEEYLAFEADEHGRFTADQSLAYRAGILERPIINEWTMELKQKLANIFPKLQFQLPKYRFQPTFDVDMAWAYRFKGVQRNIGASFRDLTQGNFSAFIERYLVLARIKNDPYDVFEQLSNLHQQHQIKPIFFFLLGEYGKYDKNIKPEHPKMQELMQNTSLDYTVGIHPSYQSNNDIWQIRKEAKHLEDATRRPVEWSRQHYLKMNFPTTYQSLVKCDIKADYSMGYADAVGFRASVAHSFYWFDLEKNEATSLRIHPFQVMDVSLKEYMKLSVEEAKEKIAYLLEVTRQFGGQFISVWHNSSFSNIGRWEAWEDVYRHLLEKGRQ